MHDRSSRGETYWRSALQRQARSGLSIARFCDQEGVSVLPVQNSLRNDSREIDFRKSNTAKHLLISSRFRSPFSDGNRIRN